MRVWLIRHGQSESNAGLPTNGPGSTPLTEQGRRQAELVADAFDRPPELIVVSPFRRARETATPTLERFPQVRCEEWPVQEFTYLGALHGPATTTRERAPHSRAYWRRADPAYRNQGDGESFSALIARTRGLLTDLAGRDEEFTAIFTHGLFVKALVWSVVTGTVRPTPDDMRAFQRFSGGYATPNGCIVELRRAPGGDPYVVAGATGHLPADLLTGGPHTGGY